MDEFCALMLEGEAKIMLQWKTHLFLQSFGFPSLIPERQHVSSGQGPHHRAEHVCAPGERMNLTTSHLPCFPGLCVPLHSSTERPEICS